jgi:hypothetical protein
MMKIYRSFIMCMLCMVFIGAQAKTILYVSSTDPAIAEDQAVIDSILTLGYEVTIVEQNAFLAGYAESSAYSGFDGIVISETISSGSLVAFATAGYPLPCVCLEGYAPKSVRWAWWANDADYYFDFIQGAVTDPDALTMVISNNSHYITKVYDKDAEVTWSTSTNLPAAENVGFKISDVIPAAIELATSKSAQLDGFPVLWAIPESSSPLSERMVLYPVHQKLMNIGEEGATFEMYRIIKRSLQWVLDDEEVTVGVNTLKNNENDVKLLGNTVNGNAKFQFNLKKAGKVSVSVVKLTGQQTLLSSENNFLAGSNTVTLNTSTLTPGMYLYVFKANNATTVGKMIVAK